MEHNHAFWLLEHLAFFQDKPRSGIASVHFHHFLHQVGRVLHGFSPLWKLALCSVYNDIYIPICSIYQVVQSQLCRKSDAIQKYVEESWTNLKATAISILFSAQGLEFPFGTFTEKYERFRKARTLAVTSTSNLHQRGCMKAETTQFHDVPWLEMTTDYIILHLITVYDDLQWLALVSS